MKIIIGIVAEMAGGKSSAAKYLEEKYGAKRYGFALIMKDLVRRLYLPENRNNLSQISVVLRKEFGNDLFARTMAEDIKKDKEHELVVVESIRREEDISFLKELQGFHLVSIKADMEIRYQRLINRTEKSDDASKSYEEFVKDHTRETELTIVPLLDKAKFIIDNNGPTEELYKKLDDIMAQLSK